MTPTLTSTLLIGAALLDYLLGDPWHWLHPVQVMGWVIQGLGERILQFTTRPPLRKLWGVGLGLLVILGSGGLGWLIVWGFTQINPWLGAIAQIILMASCLAGRSLRLAAMSVLEPLQRGDLARSRSQLSRYVGRDTDGLNAEEILRAVLETVAENSIDGVTAPLFYALVGAFLPGYSLVALPLAYKASSTLDSMIGYRREPYADLGWFSAQVDDLLTWLPCRLTVLTLALLARKPRQVWRICWRDAPQDPSPNSGWSEGVYAAILGVQLGGINYYQGVRRDKPLLGDAIATITPATIEQALNLTRSCCLLWLGLALWLSHSQFIL